MTVTIAEIRSGAYFDSVVLMQLQRSLAALPGVRDAGVVMGTAANKDILAQTGLLAAETEQAKADDLVIVVKAHDEAAARLALAQVDQLMVRRRHGGDQDYRPKSLESAASALPDARWVLVSVPGHYATGVSREALRLGKHVFLYSDNVSLEDEVALKQEAVQRGLLVMGPDCGTAIIQGVGLGFANAVRRGPVGIVAASGTGLQQVSARIHQLGSGITHAIGTGGRDLSHKVGGTTALQALDLLKRDPDTRAIVLVSKPPSAAVAAHLLEVARRTGKPIVIDFVGYPAASRRVDNLHFALTFDEAAVLAVELAKQDGPPVIPRDTEYPQRFAAGQRYLRGLFSGGTLAYESLLLLQDYLPSVRSNVPLKEAERLANPRISEAHTIVDMGEDEFTVGRLHPMMDNDLRIRRLWQEARDPEVAIILLDVVLGYGAHPDPASELAPVIADARAEAAAAGRHLEVVAVVVGTDDDPQNLEAQVRALGAAGAHVETSNEAAVHFVGQRLRALHPPPVLSLPAVVELAALQQPLAAINVGLEFFAESLQAQGARAIHVDWRPPAGGNERLMLILERMKQ